MLPPLLPGAVLSFSQSLKSPQANLLRLQLLVAAVTHQLQPQVAAATAQLATAALHQHQQQAQLVSVQQQQASQALLARWLLLLVWVERLSKHQSRQAQTAQPLDTAVLPMTETLALALVSEQPQPRQRSVLLSQSAQAQVLL